MLGPEELKSPQEAPEGGILAAEIGDDESRRYGVVSEGTVRADRWLWAARIFKTRSLAAKACQAGHVKLAGDSVKASKNVSVGDRLEVVTSAAKRVLVVRRLTEKRGPASVARALYDDLSPPPPPRDETDFAVRNRGAGRPEKRDRRLLMRLRGR